MNTTETRTPANEYKSLYDMLDNCTYILNNDIERFITDSTDDGNYELYEKLSQMNYDNAMREKMRYQDFYNLDNMEEYNSLLEGNEDIALSEFLTLEDISDDLKEEIEGSIYDMDFPDIYQTFIVDDYTKEILEDFGEFVYEVEDAGLILWGVMHYGTAWSHIMGNQVPIQNKERYKK